MSKSINKAPNLPRFNTGDRVTIIPTGKTFTVEEVYWVDGFGWRYLSFTDDAGAYQTDLRKADNEQA